MISNNSADSAMTIEQLETENEKLPKTKRRYMTEDGKVVGYLTAKKLGIIS